MFNVVELKDKIKEISNLTENDRKVLLIVDSFWGCPVNWVKANLASKIARYVGCETWKIAMNYTYIEH